MREIRERKYLELDVGTSYEGKTVREFLERELHLSERLISRMKYREDGIFLNGERRRTTALLQAGDRLRLSVEDPGESGAVWLAPETPVQIPVLYEDEDLIVVYKPEGMVCHPSFGHFRDSLANHAACLMGWEGTSREMHLIGRLDRDTCGLVAIAKNAGAAAELFREQREGVYRKTYLALAEGVFPEKTGVIDLPLERVPGVFLLRRTAPGGKPAKTFYEVIREQEGRTLVRCRLEHGRTHQIRVHMASAGHPLAGDRLYGPGGAAEVYNRTGNPEDVKRQNDASRGGESLGLCAYRLTFRHPYTGKWIDLTADLPDWAELGK